MSEQCRLADIESADVAGYSQLMGQDESGTLAALKVTRLFTGFSTLVMAHRLLPSAHFRFWPKCEVPTGDGNICCGGQTGHTGGITKPTRLTQSGHRPNLGRTICRSLLDTSS
jgi:hypothetical protein